MLRLQELCVQYDDTLMHALRVINDNGEGIVFVQKDKIFYGTLTDGDIRRAIISGADHDMKLGSYCNNNALSLPIFSYRSL